MNWRRVTASYTIGSCGSRYMPFTSKKRSWSEMWRST